MSSSTKSSDERVVGQRDVGAERPFLLLEGAARGQLQLAADRIGIEVRGRHPCRHSVRDLIRGERGERRIVIERLGWPAR
jgi:hypothetical protein